jgi:hypothetical protein
MSAPSDGYAGGERVTSAERGKAVTPSPPALRVSEIGGRVRLGLDGFGKVEGDTLQEAADELVARLLSIAMVLRSTGIGPLCSECSLDLAVVDFVWQLGNSPQPEAIPANCSSVPTR